MQMWKSSAAVSFTLANLWYFRSWSVLVEAHAPTGAYFLEAHPVHLEASTLASVLSLAAALFLCRLVAHRFAAPAVLRIGRGVWAAAACGAAFSVLAYAATFPEPAPAISVLLLLGGALSLLIFWRHAYRLVHDLLLILFPFALLTFVLSGWRIATSGVWHTHASFETAPPAGPAARKVIWLIFDEMGSRLILHPEAPVRVPNLERLARESLHATAVSPAGDSTLKAVPSLFTGLEVRHSEPVSDRGLRLTFADGRAALWDEVPNWFRHVKAKGLGVAAAGFYHPYCRALPDSFDDCYWEPYAVLPAMVWSNYTEPMGPRSFFYHTLRELRFHPMLHPLLLDTMRRVSLDPEENEIIARQSGQLSRLLVQAQRMVTDPNLGVVYVHLPVPHAYGIWNGREQRTARAREGSYVENLQLADRVLGEFRDFLERNGIWDEATVLVTSDHALRTEYWNSNLAGFVPDTPLLKKPPRIPFLFKLPRQPGGLVYQRPFTAKVSAGLMQAALEGRVQSYQDAARWLDSSEFWKPAFEHFPEIGRRNAHADVKRPE